MDYKDIISQIQDDINRRTENILGKSQRTVDSILNKKIYPADKSEPQKDCRYGIEKLVEDDRLEESTRSKIGTFEKLYQNTYVADSKVPLYGYDDLDYASLVNLLASALEIELNMSLYQAIRKEAGIAIPKYAWTDVEKKEIYVSGQTVDLGKAKQMYGPLLRLFAKYDSVTSRVVGDASDFTGMLSKIARVRNKADHTEMIDKNDFLAFYSMYSSLFNRYIGNLLNLKQSYKKSKKDYSAVSYGDADRYDAFSDDYIKGIKIKAAGNSKKLSRPGIIFTDTRKIAYKYYAGDKERINGDIYSRSGAIRKVLNEYMVKLQEFGISYSLLDLGEGQYDYILNERQDLNAYLDILQDISMKAGITSDTPNNLFIIGGTDVIPMAVFHNPGQDPEKEAIDDKSLDNTVDSDLPYAYELSSIKINSKNELSLDALSGSIGKPRYFVGRLPLENGYMKTSITDDIYSYLERSIAAFAEGGIAVDSPLMTTCRNAMEVGAYMIQDIPVMSHEDFPEELSTLNMITSPALALDQDSKGRYTQNGVQTFATKVAKSDMLIFLLHGSGVPSVSHYCGDYQDEKIGRIQPVAFVPELLSHGKIKSIATVSCFGAKFIDYDRKSSTLLSAIYGDTVSFMGSSRSAFGDFDDSMEMIENATGKHFARFSVRLMNYYLHLLFSGIPAAEALSRAKIKYMSGVTSEEYPERIPEGMTTILEFNYFGDPALYLQPRINMAESYNNLPEKLPGYCANGDGWRREFEEVQVDLGAHSGSLLSRIRSMVDKGFERIHVSISEKLYKEWGIPPRELYTVHKFTSKNGDKGYSLRYRHNEGVMSTDTIVITDLQGAIEDIYHTY